MHDYNITSYVEDLCCLIASVIISCIGVFFIVPLTLAVLVGHGMNRAVNIDRAKISLAAPSHH